MTGFAKLLADCDAHGIRLSLAGEEGLTVDAPQDVLTLDLIHRLKAHKTDLLVALRHAEAPAAVTTASVVDDHARRASQPKVSAHEGHG